MLHIDTLFSDYTPKLEVVRDEGCASNSEVDFSEGLILLFKYYPYGMLMPGRFGEAGNISYRYGHNGMEKDDEIKGKGNSVNYKYRMHDPRLGRWLSIDPVTHPRYSSYSEFDNNIIYFTDASRADVPLPKSDEGWGQYIKKYNASFYSIESEQRRLKISQSEFSTP